MSDPLHTQRRAPLTLTAEQTEFTDIQIQALGLVSGWHTEPPAAALHLFFHAATTSGLDPFHEQIRLLQRREPVATANGGTRIEQRWSVETSIHGFRILGHRAARDRGALVERSDPSYYDERSRQWCDAWPYDTPPVAARCELSAVYVDGNHESAVGVVHYAEFVKATIDGAPTRGWEKMPCHMLAKCAEVDAWRRLFPQELGWLRLADGADTANNSIPVDSTTATTRRPTQRRPIEVLGEPPTPSTTPTPTATATATATPASKTGVTSTQTASSADPADEPAKKASSDSTPPEVPTARRGARRPAAGRSVNATTGVESRSALLATAATTLRRDPAGVLAWATQQLGRPINEADQLTDADLPRLQAALPAPAPAVQDDDQADSSNDAPIRVNRR